MASAKPHIAENIGLVFKALNASRGRIAAEIGVDKSLVGRWANGIVTPSDHNLARLTDLVRRKVPNFTRASWDLSGAEFSAAVGLPPSDDGAWVKTRSAAPDEDGEFGVAARARHEAGRYGQAYPGFYRMFRQSFSNSGAILVGSVQILRRREELLIRYSDGLLSYRGRLYLLNCQVFGVLGECGERDMMMFLVLNGVTAMRALQLDGILSGVSGDKTHAPTAMTVVLLRQADLSGDASGNEALWRGEVQAALAANRDGAAVELLPEALRALLFNRVGPAGAGAEADHVLRLPPSRSVSKGVGAPLPAPA